MVNLLHRTIYDYSHYKIHLHKPTTKIQYRARTSPNPIPAELCCYRRVRNYTFPLRVTMIVVFVCYFLLLYHSKLCKEPWADLKREALYSSKIDIEEKSVNKSDGLINLNATNFHISIMHLSSYKSDILRHSLFLIQSFREEFYERFGGKELSIRLVREGVILPVPQLNELLLFNTAKRILSFPNSPFRMSFAGYSVTVGRGNYLSQSYPFVIERLLSPLFLQMFHRKLEVINAAIGGIPSFPYGWCQNNFLGEDIDVISWDYGMNEGHGAVGLETYLRHTFIMNQKHNILTEPMVILLDSEPNRLNLLRSYVSKGYFIDSLAVGIGKYVINPKMLDKTFNDTTLPEGYRKWNEWGAPKGSPGQSPWHPKYKEHELIGWIISLHFVNAMEVAVKMRYSQTNMNIMLPLHYLPRPFLDKPVSLETKSAENLLYGWSLKPFNYSNFTQYEVNPLLCRTSFMPIVSGDLTSLVIAGMVNPSDNDKLEWKHDSLYNKGWVLDVGKVEYDTKLKVQQVNKGKGMGYIDKKLALYGIPSSGTLRLWLPYQNQYKSVNKTSSGDNRVNDWFYTLILCEVNEKRSENECNIANDLLFYIGGVRADKITRLNGVASYLKKDICVHVEIPSKAVVMKWNDIQIDNNIKIERKKIMNNYSKNIFGMSLDVSVKRMNITRKNGACSISHVIWGII